MSGATMIVIIGLSISSMAFILLFSLLKETKVTEEKLRKILGEKACNELCNAKNEEEIKEIIRGLKKSQKWKLKTLLESQDIRDAIKAIRIHIIKDLKPNQD